MGDGWRGGVGRGSRESQHPHPELPGKAGPAKSRNPGGAPTSSACDDFVVALVSSVVKGWGSFIEGHKQHEGFRYKF